MSSATPGPVRALGKFFFEGDRKFIVKGITYGPFRPDAAGHYLGTPEQLARDLAQMREIGLNVVRIYHTPPLWFLDGCAAAGMRVMITLPWAKHIEFLRDRSARNAIVTSVRTSVAEHAGHPAIFGYLVGNEVSPAMVRWLGVQRVSDFLEHLIGVARAENSKALFSYASYPPTEFLLPQNVDFFCFNVYLHHQHEFERYLLRLHNLAEDRPLMLGEFGMDTLRHSEDEQAAMLGWHIESVVKCGLAGTVLFAWTDEWYTGEQEITDWAFGIVTRERQPKKSFALLREKFGQDDSAFPRVPLPRTPSVSVIVCSYNGASTLAACLESLGKIDYPSYEVILVDDGSTDNTPEIAARFPHVRYLRQENHGLSHARNTGGAAARGEILAYTDSDCMADRDWLYYMVETLLSGDFAGVGGPNIPPPAEDWVQACVAAAPGGPSHILLTDTVAEHIPGCNMAWYRWVFENVGGFDPDYLKAGDDVDFCWRVQQDGREIAFSPSAVVWHHRRFTLAAFQKQQQGYGEAESLLRFKHLIFFGPTGAAKWRGQIYGSPRFSWFINRPIIYHGVFGEGFFQSIYPTPRSEIAGYLSSVEWFALTVFLFGLGIFLPEVRIVPYLMLGGTLCVALSYMLHARIEPRFDTIPARLLVMFLAFSQPLVRGWSRYFTWLQFKRTPEAVIGTHEALPAGADFSGNATRRSYWTENGNDRHAVLTSILELLETEGWRYSTDTGWNNWDIHIYGNFWWSLNLKSVTEYHGGGKCLTRVNLRTRPVATTVIINLVVVTLLLYHLLNTGTIHPWVITPYFLFLAFLAWRAQRLKRRVAELIDVAAYRIGLQRIGRKRAAAAASVDKVVAPAKAG